MPDSIDITRSAELFERGKQVLAGGVSRNTLFHDGPMLYADHAKGCRIYDVEGVERIDFANNMASLIHGHASNAITSAVLTQMARGTAYTMATEAEVQFAELLCRRCPSIEKIRFLNSGTEAVMAGLKAARAFTGRPKIAKVEGCYHGAYDYAEVSQAPKPENWGDSSRPQPVPLAQGTPDGVVSDVVILPFNDPKGSIEILEEHGKDIACILIDLIPHRVGMIPANKDFVAALKEWADANGTLLMFDEVITFRNGYGGMQEHYGIKPDLTSMGKIIGGGFPVGAIAGSSEVMDVFVSGANGMKLPLSGTFSANPISMIAGYTAISLYDASAVARLNGLGEYARKGLELTIKSLDVPCSVTGSGSLFRIHLKAEKPKNYRDAFNSPAEAKALSALISALYDNGIMMIHTASAALSTPMETDDIDFLCVRFRDALNQIRHLIPDQ